MRHARVRAPRAFAATLCLAFALHADQPLPPELQGVGLDEHLNRAIDLNLTFTGENGYPVALKQFFHKDRPVILNLVYYSCPMLCNLLLNGQTAALKQVPWSPGNEFEVVTISIDPTETFNLAQQKRAVYLESYGRETSGWHFLTDDHGNVKKLADQIGFHYRYDERQSQYAHPAVITVLTPEGRISRYLYGIKFDPRDIRLALTEASESKWGLSVDRVLLYCFHYDPQAHGYVLFASNLMRAGGALTVLILALVLFRLWRRESRAPAAPREVLAQ
jgi:protein SCO1/2